MSDVIDMEQTKTIDLVQEDKLDTMLAEAPALELSAEDQKTVNSYVSGIDITDTQMVLQYGAGAQRKIADFSESALNSVRTKDLGEVGTMLSFAWNNTWNIVMRNAK